ncbi:hypothetical protein MCU_01033 [Bartonella elizabethae Re6043vi]|uniref:Uncharacterized protein n=1 Tax=Bartonella elizabethae Re6043vi TaxID=1094554 RepID=A0ABN0GJ95_BAREL|nr:hypothetical protein MCU_01033 [Bartonella elizabethae Re6043vi]
MKNQNIVLIVYRVLFSCPKTPSFMGIYPLLKDCVNFYTEVFFVSIWDEYFEAKFAYRISCASAKRGGLAETGVLTDHY